MAVCVAAITGLVAKENVVGTFGILYGFAEVSENGSEILEQSRGYLYSGGSSVLPGVQPALRAVLRRYGLPSSAR